jgi:hypothetical protein
MFNISNELLRIGILFQKLALIGDNLNQPPPSCDRPHSYPGEKLPLHLGNGLD